MDSEQISRAAEAIQNASAMLICAGAGMGVDSGLPDFRGDKGFWKAYPPYEKLGLSFVDMANPDWFRRDPELGWGFYGHRLNLYRETTPHRGFQLLLEWSRKKPRGTYVFTSNVDGHFQRAGFPQDNVAEAHGSIHWMQCTVCDFGIFSADEYSVSVDLSTMRAAPPLPACPLCGALARPNILMFGDDQWHNGRSAIYSRRLHDWLRSLKKGELVIIECGAGSAVPTVRLFSDQVSHSLKATLIRINLREPDVPPGEIGIPRGALETITAIDSALPH